MRRKIELAPEIVFKAGKDCFSTGLVTMQATGDVQNALQIVAGGAFFAVFLNLAQGLLHEVFGQNGLFFMRFVPWSIWLEIKTQRAGFFLIGLKLSQLTDIFAGNHYEFSG